MMAHEFMSMNKIPDTLPISTLVCAPSQTFVKQYIHQTATVNVVNDNFGKDRFDHTAPVQTGIASARIYNLNNGG
jgi:hypothetical protein